MYKFIDLFSGIGGFHLAFAKDKCVFSSEINDKAVDVYKNNFNIIPEGDITEIPISDIPDHDFLLGGFPCQPFSKAGHRKGLNDSRGQLFFNIENILKNKKPTFFILENVTSLITNNKGETYKMMINSLKKLGYLVPEAPIILSPIMFGVPQLRRRVIIPGILKEKAKFDKLLFNIPSMSTKLNHVFMTKYDSDKSLKLSEYENKVLDCWSEFSNHFKDKNEIRVPIWYKYFFKEIDYSNEPEWKKKMIIRNELLYENNKSFIDTWSKKWDIESFRNQDMKLEWNMGNKVSSLDDGIVQFRSSGVRVKLPAVAPTLVALNERIVNPSSRRYISIEEVAKLQSFPSNFKFSDKDNISLKQLGNAVNIDVIKYARNELLKNEK